MSKTDDEVTLDLSWESDLKTVWANRDDEYAGPVTPPEEPTGVTVGGTTDDDLGDESTTLLPEDVPEDELTGKQHSILETAVMQPNASKVELAAAVGASPQYVADVCGRWLPDHPAATVSSGGANGQTQIGEWVRGDRA